MTMQQRCSCWWMIVLQSLFNQSITGLIHVLDRELPTSDNLVAIR